MLKNQLRADTPYRWTCIASYLCIGFETSLAQSSYAHTHPVNVRCCLLNGVMINEEFIVQNETDEVSDMEIEANSEMTRANMSLRRSGTEVENNDSNMRNSRRLPIKRSRVVDENEIWTTVERRGKRFARLRQSGERIPEDKIEISVTAPEALPKQFGLAKLLKSQNIVNIIRVKYVNAYKVLIQLSDEDSAETLLNCELFKTKGYKCQKTYEMDHSFGVIKNIETDLAEEDILESLKSSTAIIGAKRLKRKSSEDGQWKNSETVRICFKGSSLPSHIYIFDTRVSVSPYVYPVTQCSRCWRFGHTQKMCPSMKTVCPKCSRFHQNCESTDFRCNNCGGRHMALARICPMYLKERKIRDLMAEFNCSYKKALLLYVPPSPSHHRQDFRRRISHESENGDAPALSRSHSEIVLPGNEDNVALSYAQTTKKTEKKNRKQSTSNAKKNKQNDGEIVESWWEGDGDSQKECEDTTKRRQNTANSGQTSWKVLLLKLKEKVLEKNKTLEEKIKGCFDILISEFLSLAMFCMTKFPSTLQKWIQTLINN